MCRRCNARRIALASGMQGKGSKIVPSSSVSLGQSGQIALSFLSILAHTFCVAN